jgi:ribonuclease HI
MEKLEVAQNKCLRLITGQYANSHTDALHLESGIPSYSTHSKQLITIAYEKGMRAPVGHPRRSALDINDITHRLLLRSSLREAGKLMSEKLSYNGLERTPSPIVIPNPWLSSFRNWNVITNREIKSDIAAILRVIDEHGATYVVYTDGSCTGGTTDGRAAAVITTGPAEAPHEIEVCQAKGSRFTCSYDEELRALNLGLDWCAATPPDHTDSISFCTDSLSLLDAIDNLNPQTEDIRQKLEALPCSLDLMYVPGHKDVPGNELADKFAKAATSITGPAATDDVSIKAVKSIVKRSIKDPPSNHRFIKLTYEGASEARDKEACKSRKEGTTLAQLRSGHHKSLG